MEFEIAYISAYEVIQWILDWAKRVEQLREGNENFLGLKNTLAAFFFVSKYHILWKRYFEAKDRSGKLKHATANQIESWDLRLTDLRNK